MELVLVLVVVVLLAVAGVVTSGVLLTRRAVRAVQASPTLRRGRELTQYAGTAVAVVRNPGRSDRTAAALAARISAAGMGLQREVTAARRAQAHLGDVPEVLPQLTDEGYALARALRGEAAAPTGRADALHEAARAHLAAVADVTAAVRASAALPAAHGSAAAVAARAAADLHAYADAYRDLTGPDRVA
ncbi:hypothetical protein SAMN03159343_0746 [Klenkia marina]|uniref:Uncharacterized protein n=1 Tax=Klenkia marina TaxID=1960309 RepID=A0A1G4XF84_9ACTN|nr:hypothetical protein [Klenkia marina]SCX39694.1 hypothetical protein SAMN03159343_0746 [Klenkia marina]